MGRSQGCRDLCGDASHRQECRPSLCEICGLDLVLHDKVQQRRRQALTGKPPAHLIAITCSPAPDGHDHWTVRLLENLAVELGFVEKISPNTIHHLLKKMN